MRHDGPEEPDFRDYYACSTQIGRPVTAHRSSIHSAVNPLWAKSPFVLVRFPGLLMSLTAGALLLALAASSYPLFISSTSSAALAREIDQVTRFGAGLLIQKDSLLVPTRARYGELVTEPEAVKEFDARERAIAAHVAGSPHLAEVVSSWRAPVVHGTPTASAGRAGSRDFRPLFRTQALDHVVRVSGREGDGVWMADLAARDLRIRPGDELRLTIAGSDAEVTVTIDGTYKALFNEPMDPYWRSYFEDIYPATDNSPAPPTFLLGDLDTIVHVSSELRVESVLQRFEVPIAPRASMTLDDARDVQSLSRTLVSNLGDETSRLGRNFCFACFGGGPDTTSLISLVVSAAERRVAPVEGPVRLLLVAGVLVAISVVAAAGAFAVATRRVEADLLYARGMSPGTMAMKTIAEAVIPSMLGASAGFGIVYGLVQAFGPGGAVDESAVTVAWQVAAISAPVSILLLGLVASASFARRSESASQRFGSLARVPWEVALLVLSMFFLAQLIRGGALVTNGATGVTRPSVYLLLFPILFIASFGTLAARSFQGLLRRVRERSDGLGSAGYVAVHRLAGAPRLTVLLFGAAALALGIFVHAQTIVRSLETTVDAKALLFVGSDVQGTIQRDIPVPDDFDLPHTVVTRVLEAGVVSPGSREVDVLIVDPATLADAAYWNNEFGAQSLEGLTSKLARPDGSEIPVVIANGSLPDADTFTHLETDVPIEVVAETVAFPGIASRRPLVVMDEAQLSAVFDEAGRQGPETSARASTELWVRGSTGEIEAALANLEDQPYSVLTAEQVKDIPSISAVIDTFGVLNVLGMGAGLLVVVVILMYLQARQRARVVSYALSRRMGLSDASHRMALVIELSILLGAAYVVGSVLALASARFIVGMVDPLAAIPPPSLFTPPILLVLAALGILIAISFAGGALTNARAKRADFAEVMRLAD